MPEAWNGSCNVTSQARMSPSSDARSTMETGLRRCVKRVRLVDGSAAASAAILWTRSCGLIGSLQRMNITVQVC